MNYKPLIVVLGEPKSVFIEIFLKTYKNLKNKIKRPIILIGSIRHFKKQMNYFKYNYFINKVSIGETSLITNNNYINIIDVKLVINKPFQKNYKNANAYIEKSFNMALWLLKNGKAIGLLNGPISKKKFLKKSYAGITEFLQKKTVSKNVAMLIYNKELSVSPVTTHVPIKHVAKKITKKMIIKKIMLLNEFYLKYLNLKPNIAVLGLNPHCETTDDYSEEKKIIEPAIIYLKKKKIRINGPFSADTFFLNYKYNDINLVVGMYHDQVLTPIKSLFKFNAINITAGLPFLRVSPDHGPNEGMISKNLSDPTSLMKSILFFEKKL